VFNSERIKALEERVAELERKRPEVEFIEPRAWPRKDIVNKLDVSYAIEQIMEHVGLEFRPPVEVRMGGRIVKKAPSLPITQDTTAPGWFIGSEKTKKKKAA
jgi:hypothetical protein